MDVLAKKQNTYTVRLEKGAQRLISFKVILYSSLILKKMNERITDN